MHNNYRILLTILFLQNCFAHNSFAQSEAGALFLGLLPGARANAMGGAQTAIANDIYASYYNPAGLTKAKTGMAGFFQTNIVVDSQTHTYWGAVHKTKLGSFGFSLNNFSSTGGLFGPVGPQKSNDRSFSFSYARKINKNWSIGGGFKIVRLKFELPENSFSATTWALDLGVLVDNLFPQTTVHLRSGIQQKFFAGLPRRQSKGFSFGIHLQNTGPAKLEYLVSSQKDPLPQMLRFGIGYLAIDADFVQFLLALDLVKELVQRHEDGSSDNFVKAWSSSWDDGFDSVHFGAKITILDLFAFRVGQERVYNISYANSADEITYGFGIGPEFARVNLVRRGFPLGINTGWILDFTVTY